MSAGSFSLSSSRRFEMSCSNAGGLRRGVLIIDRIVSTDDMRNGGITAAIGRIGSARNDNDQMQVET